MRSSNFDPHRGRDRRLSAAVAVLGTLGLVAFFIANPLGQEEGSRRRALPGLGRVAHAQTPPGRVIVLGFDGMDPDFLGKWMKAGDLPHFKKLADSGSFHPLESTIPPQSPVAWASFITGTGPGEHGIFDFVTRDPKTYFPQVGTQEVEGALVRDGKLVRGPRAYSRRVGRSFWDIAAAKGSSVTVLTVPFSFPPEEEHSGESRKILAGLGVPDLRGTNSTFTFVTSDPETLERVKGYSGGALSRLTWTDGVGTATLEGPRDPYTKKFARLGVPLVVRRGEDALEIEVQKQKVSLREGQWSRWLDITYSKNEFRARGFMRMFLIAAGEHPRLYISPLNPHLEDGGHLPPIASPVAYGEELFERYKHFKTVGWVHDTSALNEKILDEDAWLEDVYRTMATRHKITLAELDRDKSDLFISVFTSTDRIPHMFFRAWDKEHPLHTAALERAHGDELLKVYKKADVIVGEVMSKLGAGDTLMILSDHGFHSFRRGFQTNRWLLNAGYLVAKGGKTPGNFLRNVDWSKTRAYALGTGQIYINLEGREKKGIVKPGRDYDKLTAEIARKLPKLNDPETGKPFINGVFIGHKVLKGRSHRKAPDLQLAFAGGYRTSWETILGGFGPGPLLTDNTRKWSGDHAASDPADTQGIFLSNRAINTDKPSIIDFAPTIMKLLGHPRVPAFEGKPLY